MPTQHLINISVFTGLLVATLGYCLVMMGKSKNS